ncbi:MAG: AtpZ/AtpI family protein [Bacillota bacterium]
MQDKGGFAKGMRAFALGSTIAVQFAVSLVLGILGGRYLDELWGTGPWLLLLGLLLGLAAGTMGIYRTVSRFMPNKESGGGKDKDDRS